MIQNTIIRNSEIFFAEIDIELESYPKIQIIQK